VVQKFKKRWNKFSSKISLRTNAVRNKRQAT